MGDRRMHNPTQEGVSCWDSSAYGVRGWGWDTCGTQACRRGPSGALALARAVVPKPVYGIPACRLGRGRAACRGVTRARARMARACMASWGRRGIAMSAFASEPSGSATTTRPCLPGVSS